MKIAIYEPLHSLERRYYVVVGIKGDRVFCKNEVIKANLFNGRLDLVHFGKDRVFLTSEVKIASWSESGHAASLLIEQTLYCAMDHGWGRLSHISNNVWKCVQGEDADIIEINVPTKGPTWEIQIV